MPEVKVAICPKCSNVMNRKLFTNPYPECAEDMPRPSEYQCPDCGYRVPTAEYDKKGTECK